MEGVSEVYPLGTLETDEPGLTSRTRPKPEENLLGVQSESSKIGTIEMREREGPDKHSKKKKGAILRKQDSLFLSITWN